MANAFICDCCSCFYKLDEFNQSIPVVDLDNSEIYISMVLAKDGKTVHLCPRCRAAIQKAWDSRATNKTTDPEHIDKKSTLYEVDEENNSIVLYSSSQDQERKKKASKEIQEELKNEQG